MKQNISDVIETYYEYMHAWNAAYAEYARSVGLNESSLSVLSVICAHDSCTQTMLKEMWSLPKQTVYTAVTFFLKKGWIQMDEMPDDRRNKTIHLTKKGKKEAGSIVKAVRGSEEQAMSDFSRSEQKQLLALTERYISACSQAIQDRRK